MHRETARRYDVLMTRCGTGRASPEARERARGVLARTVLRSGDAGPGMPPLRRSRFTSHHPSPPSRGRSPSRCSDPGDPFAPGPNRAPCTLPFANAPPLFRVRPGNIGVADPLSHRHLRTIRNRVRQADLDEGPWAPQRRAPAGTAADNRHSNRRSWPCVRHSPDRAGTPRKPAYNESRLSDWNHRIEENWGDYSGHEEAYGNPDDGPDHPRGASRRSSHGCPAGAQRALPCRNPEGPPHRGGIPPSRLPVVAGPQLETDWLLTVGWQKSFESMGHH